MHLQMMPGLVFPGDNSGSARAFVEDFVEPQVVLGSDGTIELPGGGGIAFHVLEDRVDRYCTFREKLIQDRCYPGNLEKRSPLTSPD